MIKKLTGKNQKDFEYAAKHVMDCCDTDVFSQLVEQDDFLFDFVKQNVAKRLIAATTEDNWQSVFSFMKFYSPFYEEFILKPVIEHADEEITDEMLEIFENGTDDEKTYCAKFFLYIQDSLALELLRRYAYSDNEYLAQNCALTLSAMKDRESYNDAINKLSCGDDFEKFAAVKFLVNYGDVCALNSIIDTMKSSAMSENIAGEIPYLSPLSDILDMDFDNGLIILNNIINGLGEIIPLSTVFDYNLYDIFDFLLSRVSDSRVAVVFLNAKEKFELLTENDEYLFDEDKNTKDEIFEIKKIFNGVKTAELMRLADKELNEQSPFVYTALELSDNLTLIRELLRCSNQTIILKTAEILKKYNNLDDTAKTVAMLKITDENIRNIIRAM